VRDLEAIRKRLAEAGRLPNASAPYGYRAVTREDVMRGIRPYADLGTLEIEEEKAGIVRNLFHEYLVVRNTNELAAALNRRQVPPRRGKRWEGTTVWWLLRNRAYIGEYVFGGWEYYKVLDREGIVRKRRRKAPPERSLVIPCPRIVDSETYELAQIILESNRRKPSEAGGQVQAAVLGEIARCAECGGLLCSGRYFGNKKMDRRPGAYHACRSCKPCAWIEKSPHPEWSTYPATIVDLFTWEALHRLVPDADADIVKQMVFEQAYRVRQRTVRRLLRTSGFTPYVSCEPFGVKLGFMNRPDATPEELRRMSKLIVLAVRDLAGKCAWAAEFIRDGRWY
jgi:hypothetical protein